MPCTAEPEPGPPPFCTAMHGQRVERSSDHDQRRHLRKPEHNYRIRIRIWVLAVEKERKLGGSHLRVNEEGAKDQRPKMVSIVEVSVHHLSRFFDLS